MIYLTHAINVLVIIALLYGLWVNWCLLKDLKSKAFVWMLLALGYGLVFRIWLELDMLTTANIYPQTETGVALIGLMYFFLALGFYGLKRGLTMAHLRRKQKKQDETDAKGMYGRRKDDQK